MRIYPAILLLLLLAPSWAWGQFSAGMHVGGGLQHYWGKGPAAASLNQTLNQVYRLQVDLGYGFSSTWSLRLAPSFDYLRRVEEVPITDAAGNDLGGLRLEQRANLATLPLLLRFSCGERLRLMAQAGPYLDWVLRGRQIADPLPGSSYPSQDIDLAGMSSVRDYGLRGSVGLGWPLGQQMHLQLWLQHDRGLKSLPFSGPNGIRFSSYYLMLGLGWP
jgi:hypothetical protein